ncbi:uncharacterized protein J3R85_011339 [Psidium guajava]|nr:uncharacterized protein J3R85_011339 [Psidium guajava]
MCSDSELPPTKPIRLSSLGKGLDGETKHGVVRDCLDFKELLSFTR